MKELSRLRILFRRRVDTTRSRHVCWLWPEDQCDRGGYGKLCYRLDGKRKAVGAHRVSYLIYNGPIPEGMEVMHVCDVPRCVNPNHLKVGTHLENEQDKVAKGRSVRGEAKSSLSDALAQELLDRYEDGESLRLLAVEFDIPYKTAEAICHRRRFKYLESKKEKNQ